MFAKKSMTFKAYINVMPLKELLDPQGKAVGNNIENIGVSDVSNVRIGKRIELLVEANDLNGATEKVETACKKLLTNVIMESYDFTLEEA